MKSTNNYLINKIDSLKSLSCENTNFYSKKIQVFSMFYLHKRGKVSEFARARQGDVKRCISRFTNHKTWSDKFRRSSSKKN